MKTTAQILRDALALLGPNGEHWRQGPWLLSNKCFCCSTAIGTAGGGTMGPNPNCIKAEGVFREVIKAPRSEIGIWRWNDAPERTFTDVKAAFERAIEAEEAAT